MGKVEQIEAGVKSLSHDELAQFRTWFFEFDADVWDRKIEAQQGSGPLERLMDEAARDFAAGKAREM